MLLIENIYLTDHNNDVIETATIQITIFSQFAVEIGKTIDEYTTKSESKSMKIYKLRIIEVIFASNKRRFVGWLTSSFTAPLIWCVSWTININI